MERVEEVNVSWDDVHLAVGNLQRALSELPIERVVGISRGGLVPAVMLSHKLNVREMLTIRTARYSNDGRLLDHEGSVVIQGQLPLIPNDPTTLIVDDLWDTGATFYKIMEYFPNCIYACLFDKWHRNDDHSAKWGDVYIGKTLQDKWLVFPWEHCSI